MSSINKIERYAYNGKEYRTLPQVKTAIENELGALIYDIDVTLTPKHRLHILMSLIENHDVYSKLLTNTVDISDDNMYSDDKNIFDIC